MKWPTNKEQAAYMRLRQGQNVDQSKNNTAENWAAKRLMNPFPGKWFRQYPWGARIFDFFNPKRGVAIEIDGSTHDEDYDAVRDAFVFMRSGIIVLRVPNFDEAALQEAISHIRHLGTWKQRRKNMGGNRKRKELAAGAGYVARGNWSAPLSETDGRSWKELTRLP